VSRYLANGKPRPIDPAEENLYPGARASLSQLVPHRFGQMDLFELDGLGLGGRIAGSKGVAPGAAQDRAAGLARDGPAVAMVQLL
jgi:hypothetical protein